MKQNTVKVLLNFGRMLLIFYLGDIPSGNRVLECVVSQGRKSLV